MIKGGSRGRDPLLRISFKISRISLMISAGLLISVVPWLADVENQCSFEFINAHPAALTIEAGRAC